MPPSLVLIGLWCFVHWVIQPSPRPITYQQLVHQGAKEGWYQVSGGFLDLNRRVRCPGNDEGDSYLALRGLGETASSPVHVLVQENNADIDNRINRINGKPANTYTSDASGNIIAQKPISDIPIPVIVTGESNPLGKLFNASLASLGQGIGPNTIWVNETYSFNVWYFGPVLMMGGVILGLIGKRLYPALYGVVPRKSP